MTTYLDPRYSTYSDAPASPNPYSLPSSPLLPSHGDSLEVGLRLTRSQSASSGQSIPIFFKASDLRSSMGSSRSEVEEEEGEEEENDDDEDNASFIDRYAGSSSAGSIRRLSINSSSSSSDASDSTLPTEPPSPLSPTTHDKAFPSSPLLSPLVFPSPSSAFRQPTSSRRSTGEPSRAPASPSFSPRRIQTAGGGFRPIPPLLSQKHSSHPPAHQVRPLPPFDAFYTPYHPVAVIRPRTAAKVSTMASYKVIPIRLVPPTPTPALREIKTAISPFLPLRAPPQTAPAASPTSHTSPPRPGPFPSLRTSKPLPPLPTFPTRSRAKISDGTSRRVRTPPKEDPQTHEAVYHLPPYPHRASPPSSPLSPRRSQQSQSPASSSSFLGLPSSSVVKRSLRAVKSSPFLRSSAYSRIVAPPSSSPPLSSPSSQLHANPSHSSLSSHLPCSSSSFFRPVPGETTLELSVSQEGFREALVQFRYRGVGEEGMLEWEVSKTEEGKLKVWPFHAGALTEAATDAQIPPVLHRLVLPADPSREYLPRRASLPISEKDGVYRLSSSSSSVEGTEPYFCFAYEVKGRKNSEGRKIRGERLLVPLVFICSPSFLHPSQSRPVGFKHLHSQALFPSATATLVIKPATSGGERAGRRPATRG